MPLDILETRDEAVEVGKHALYTVSDVFMLHIVEHATASSSAYFRSSLALLVLVLVFVLALDAAFCPRTSTTTTCVALLSQDLEASDGRQLTLHLLVLHAHLHFPRHRVEADCHALEYPLLHLGAVGRVLALTPANELCCHGALAVVVSKCCCVEVLIIEIVRLRHSLCTVYNLLSC
jgi:hypothetical protein